MPALSTSSSKSRAHTSGAAWLGAALAFLLCFATLTIWVEERWAVCAFEAGIFLLTAGWCICWAVRPFPFYAHWLLAIPGAAVLIGTVQLVFGATVYAFETQAALVQWFTLLCLVWLGLQVFANPHARQRMLDGFLAFAVCLALLGIAHRASSGGSMFWLWHTSYPDVLGPFLYHNDYAAFLELALPIALWRALFNRGEAMRYGATAAVLLGCLAASASRAGSFLGLLETATMVLFALRRPHARRVALVVGLGGLTAAVTLGWQPLGQRLSPSHWKDRRPEMWRSAAKMVRDHALLGVGLGNFPTAYPEYASFDDGTRVNHAHNEFLEWGSEGGVLLAAGLFVGLWLVAAPALRTGWGIGLAAVLLHALVDYPFRRLGLVSWYFLLATLFVSTPKSIRSGKITMYLP